MSQAIINQIESKFKKSQVVDVSSGDTVRVHQKIKEGNKERIQIFQGLVIRADRKASHTSRITVRRISSGVGVEKSFLVHSPLIIKIEVTKRSKVRRNYLSYMRALTGKATRLSGIEFDKEAVNSVVDKKAEQAIEEIHEKALEEHEAEADSKNDVKEAPETKSDSADTNEAIN